MHPNSSYRHPNKFCAFTAAPFPFLFPGVASQNVLGSLLILVYLGDVIDVGGVVVVGDVDEKSLVYAQHNRFIFL